MTNKKSSPLNFLELIIISCVAFPVLFIFAAIAGNISETLNLFFNTTIFTDKSARGMSFPAFLILVFPVIIYFAYFFLKNYFGYFKNSIIGDINNAPNSSEAKINSFEFDGTEKPFEYDQDKII